MINTVVKSDGSRVPFEPNRLNKAAMFGGEEDNSNLWTTVALDASRRLYEGCSTREVQQAMIDACIDRKTQKYSDFAGRLLVGSIYKAAFGGFTKIPTLRQFYTKMVEERRWEHMGYSFSDLEALEEVIDHSKDLKYGYAVLKQFRDKYAIRDAVNDILFESPQMMFMGMAMAVMKQMPHERRLQDVEKLYTYLSDLKINAPTPYLNGLRTGATGYASCCLIKADDSAPSIGAAKEIAYTMTTKQAGIGYYLSSRSIGDGVRRNTIKHQGKLPYYRGIDSAVKENRQSTRGGSATVSFLSLDPEVEDLLNLKNPLTVVSKRISTMDYSVGINRSFIRRVAKDQEWMLVSRANSPELHEAMFRATEEEFDALVEEIKAKGIPHKMVKARDIAKEIITQRAETGRMYIYWTDEANRHTPFKDTIFFSNLCQEVLLPTKGYTDMRNLFKDNGDDGEIALCFLASLVAGRVSEEEYEDVAYYTVLMIDNVMQIMEYPYESLAFTANARRSIGVGLTNVAHYLASNEAKYSSKKAKQLIHELTERHSFFLHKASLRLAKERGVAPWIDRTKYPEGWLPIDTYCKDVDSVVPDATLKYDWETLRAEIIANGGIRNSVLEAYMPNESSSLATNTTNGLYPIREPVLSKKSPQGTVLFLAPEYEKYQEFYERAWDIPTKDLIEIYAITQKFTGQAISSDFYLDYSKLPGGKISQKDSLSNLIYATKLGMKTHYYLNSRVGAGDSLTDQLSADDGADCDSCKL